MTTEDTLRNKIILALVALLLLGGSLRAYAGSVNYSLNAGDNLLVNCTADELAVLPVNAKSVNVTCKSYVPAVTATAAPTVAPQPTAAPTAPPAPTTAPQPTVAPQPTSVPVTGASVGIWLSTAEIQALPMSGTGWSNVKAKADGSWGSPNLSDLNSDHDVLTLAGALVYVRTGNESYRAKVASAIMSAIGTESSSRALEISRNIQDYVIAADLINFKAYDAGREATFRSWLSAVRNQQFDGMSIIQSHEKRPNNWGTHAGAARVIIARYLGDTTDLNRAWLVFQGWAGDRSKYAGFSYGDLSWQCNSSAPVGINPVGCVKSGLNIDGVLPDDQRRAGSFTTNPPNENYVWEAMQGATVQAVVLNRAGFPALAASSQAIKRAAVWMYTVNGFPPDGDDTWIPFLLNKVYGTSFATDSGTVGLGKNMSFTDWMTGAR